MKGQADRPSAVSHRATGRHQQLAGTPKPQVGICKVAIGLLFLLICGLLLIPAGTFAQEFRATISGTVVDPSGAVVPEASIVVREAHTGAINRTMSDSVGQYVVPFLLPGDYSITVTKTGFQTLIRSGIELQAQEHPIINLALTLGSETRTVTVTTGAPLADQANASVGEVISPKAVEDLPLSGYAPAVLAELSVGVITTSPPQQAIAFGGGTMINWSIGGTKTNESEGLLDGAVNMALNGSGAGGLAFSPSEDTVQEVSVRVFSTDASEGHTIAGVVNEVTKSGTNVLHGTAYEFAQLWDLDANLYFNKRTVPVTPTPAAPYNQYGLSTGGPIWIPKVFNGKNKLFFFFAWEGIHQVTPLTTITTVPTDAEREGDFSALLAGGTSYQLYEPNTGTLVNGAFTRTPVPNNCLTNKSSYCSSRANAGITIDPIAANILKLYPEPNYTSGVSPITNQDNYNSNAPSITIFHSEFGRLDYNMSARNHMFFDFRHNLGVQSKQNYFGNNTTGSDLFRETFGATLDDVITMNPTTLFDVRLDWADYDEVHNNPANVYSPTSLGFPAGMTSASDYPGLPYIAFNGSSYQDLSETGASLDPSTIYQVFGDLMKLVGKHTLKIGFDGRQYRSRLRTWDDADGSFTFGNSFVTSGTSGSSQPFGGDLASFEYGLPTKGEFDLEPLGDYRSYYVASFIQDDWRVNKHLMLNLGLRFDLDTPYGEKFGRTESGFNASAVNSASAAATAAFIPATVTKNNTTVTVSSINTLGGLTFPGSDWGAPYKIENNKGYWSPRIGFSYSPGIAWLKKTVVRGGFGIFVMPQALNGHSYSDGFAASTSYVATTNNYFTNASTLDNPFPSGFTQPAGASQGANTFLGAPSSITFFAPVEYDQYSERWTLGVQESLTDTTLLEVIYEGNHALHLPVNNNLNSIGRQYLTTNLYRDQNLATALGTAVTNPFAGLLPLNGSYNGTTTALSNLLVPFPAFGGASVTEEQLTNGQSFFESGMVHIEQRARHGLTLTANYSFAKDIEEDTYLNPEDTKLFRGISPNDDYKQHFTVGGVYELPFGRGKLFSLGGSKLADEIAGGWVLNGIYQFQTGLPINLSADIPFQPGMTVKDIKSSPRNTSPTSPALTNASSVFVTGSGTSCTVAAGQPCDGTVFFNGQYADHYRTMPTTIGSVRSDGYNDLDSSVLKNFHFTEKAYLQLRFETFNTLNHPIFAAPNVSSATASNFGYITGADSGSLPRQVQLGGRIVF